MENQKGNTAVLDRPTTNAAPATAIAPVPVHTAENTLTAFDFLAQLANVGVSLIPASEAEKAEQADLADIDAKATIKKLQGMQLKMNLTALEGAHMQFSLRKDAERAFVVATKIAALRHNKKNRR